MIFLQPCYKTISYSEHHRGSENIGFVNMCGLVHVGLVYFVLSRLFTYSSYYKVICFTAQTTS